jgi:outer membrane lipoprotein SlyB
MSFTKNAGILAAAAALGLAGCAASDPYQTTSPGGASYPSYPPYQGAEVARYGYVESVETVAHERRQGPGVGAIGGAVAGGALGNQVGHGTGRAAATVGGAVIGGVIGHQVEQRVRGNEAAGVEYRFRVRMDDGSYQTFNKETHDGIQVGDRVKVERNNVFRL